MRLDQITAKMDQVSDSLEVTNTIMLEKVHASIKMLMTQGLAIGKPSFGQSAMAGHEKVQTCFGRQAPGKQFRGG